jgi:ribokinase
VNVIVLGSINMDLVVRTSRIPLVGETLSGTTFETTPGGKGANQAVACARLGANTTLLGCVGQDVFAQTLVDSLANNRVDISHIERVATSSGVALITVSEQGDNTIVVVAGANDQVGATALRQLDSLLKAGDILLLQLEVPMEGVINAAKLAHHRGATVILDPAPARELPAELYPYIHIITPNQTEAGILAQQRVESKNDAEQVARVLQGRGVPHVVVKLGGEGVIYAHGNDLHHLPTFKVDVVDTVAAGDAFNGGLATALAQGLPMLEALRWGLASGAMCVTRRGAQTAMPTREEVLGLLGHSG